MTNIVLFSVILTLSFFLGGVADRHGGLKRGDQLLSVNGVSVENEHHEKAVDLLKAAQGKLQWIFLISDHRSAYWKVQFSEEILLQILDTNFLWQLSMFDILTDIDIRAFY